MNSLEDKIRDALRSEAGRLREVRPLRLEPAPYRLAPGTPPRRARVRWAWLAPVTATALVLALAIALVIVRTDQNGPAVPPVVPQPAAPSAFPRYFLGLGQLGSDDTGPRVVVGDLVAGKTIASFTAAAGMAFEASTGTGAADDRTFVIAETATQAGGPNPNAPYLPSPRAWYLLRVSPGSAGQVTMTRLPIKPSAPGLPATDAVLSPDGRYLAVSAGEGSTRRADIQVYSIASGQLVHAWTMANAGTLSPSYPGDLPSYPGDLSWVNGDDAVAFDIYLDSREQVRTVPVTAPGTELLTASRVVWTEYGPAAAKSLPEPGAQPGCYSPTLTADGRTVTCWSLYLSAPGEVSWKGAMEWLAYSVSAPTRPRVIARIPSAVTAKRPTGFSVYSYWGIAQVSDAEVIGYYGFYETRLAASSPVTIDEYVARGGIVRQLGTGTIPGTEKRMIW